MKFEKYGEKPTRHGFAQGLVELGEENPDVYVFGADVTGSVKTSEFQKEFPDRFFSIGVAEQNATTIAAGFALSGKTAVFSSYSAFSAFRNADQLRVSVCYNEANVKIGGGHSGITVGPDGATHQSLEEISFLRALPNMTLVVPCDFEETRKAIKAVGRIDGPAFVRFGRSAVPMFTKEDTPFEIGKSQIYREGSDVAIFAIGLLVWEALIAAEKLKEDHGIEARVINNASIKPLDFETIVESAQKCGCFVTAEEHQVIGGLSGAVSEILAKNYPIPGEFLGIADQFGQSGEPNELLDHYNLNWKGIYASALKAVERKKKGFIGTRPTTDISKYEN
jgi:transketolase